MASRHPWVAFALSLVIPGAGLCYLDRWGWGVLNFLIVQGAIVAVLLGPFPPAFSEYFHYILLIMAAASAGVAHAVAERSLRTTRSTL